MIPCLELTIPLHRRQAVYIIWIESACLLSCYKHVSALLPPTSPLFYIIVPDKYTDFNQEHFPYWQSLFLKSFFYSGYTFSFLTAVFFFFFFQTTFSLSRGIKNERGGKDNNTIKASKLKKERREKNRERENLTHNLRAHAPCQIVWLNTWLAPWMWVLRRGVCAITEWSLCYYCAKACNSTCRHAFLFLKHASGLQHVWSNWKPFLHAYGIRRK